MNAPNTDRPTAPSRATWGCLPECRSSQASRNGCRTAARSASAQCGPLATRTPPAPVTHILFITYCTSVDSHVCRYHRLQTKHRENNFFEANDAMNFCLIYFCSKFVIITHLSLLYVTKFWHIRGIHTRTCVCHRLSVLRHIWPVRCHVIWEILNRIPKQCSRFGLKAQYDWLSNSSHADLKLLFLHRTKKYEFNLLANLVRLHLSRFIRLQTKALCSYKRLWLTLFNFGQKNMISKMRLLTWFVVVFDYLPND